MSDPVKFPDHYRWHPTGVECKEIVAHFPFNRGTAIKYVWRAGRKGGPDDEIRDLEKAIESLRNEVSILKTQRARNEEVAIHVPGFRDLADKQHALNRAQLPEIGIP